MAAAPAAAVKPETPPEYSMIDYLQRRMATQPPLLQFPSDPAKVPEIKGFFEVAPIVGGGFCLAAATSLGYWANSMRIGRG